MRILSTIQKIGHTLGIEVQKYPTRVQRHRLSLFERNSIDLVLDVGANVGQFGDEIRKNRYEGELISFEPMSSAFSKLSKRVVSDSKWTARNYGLGALNETKSINISHLNSSSSILELDQNHFEANPDVKYIGKEDIEIRSLDSIFESTWKTNNVFLKLDVQGYELQVLKGAHQSLPNIKGLQVELSLAPLYRGEAEYMDIIGELKRHGFHLHYVIPGYTNQNTGQMLQVDGLFFKG